VPSLSASRNPFKYPKATDRIQGLYLSHPLLLHPFDFNAWTDFPVFKNLLKICLLHFSKRCSCADWRNQMAVHAVLILEHLSHFCQKFTCLIFLLRAPLPLSEHSAKWNVISFLHYGIFLKRRSLFSWTKSAHFSLVTVSSWASFRSWQIRLFRERYPISGKNSLSSHRNVMPWKT